MSDATTPTPKHRVLRDELLADEWWGNEATTGSMRAVGANTPRRPAIDARTLLQRVGGAVLHVPRKILGRARTNSRFRRFAVTVASIVVVAGCIAGAVSVIMLNNIVIERSAELGELEQRRRDLRTDNALVASELAKLSAPPRIIRLARKRLGMEYSDDMPRFIYLDEANRPMTPQRRRQIERRARRAERAKAAGETVDNSAARAAEQEALAFADSATGGAAQ